MHMSRDIQKNMKRINPGIDNFKILREKNEYYVDKTLFIKDFIDEDGPTGTKLILRPRRFGKTLMQSTLQYFFDTDLKEESVDLFNGLAISKEKDIVQKHMNKYPVISLTFKDIKTFDGDDYLNTFKSYLAGEYIRHKYLLELDMEKKERLSFNRIIDGEGKVVDYYFYLSLLSKLLHQYHNVRPLILIDEYDVPLNSSYQKGEDCHKAILDLMSNMFSSALKSNADVNAALITGCLQIAKNQIYTGLNNLKIYSVHKEKFNKYFGFEKHETTKMLDYYNLDFRYDDVKANYDGYNFGGIEIYNPWSLLSFVYNNKRTKEKEDTIITIKESIFNTFLSLGKKGQDAYILYSYLLQVAKANKTKKIELTFELVKDKLKWGRNKYFAARRILLDLGLLIVVYHRNDKGRFTDSFTEIYTNLVTNTVPVIECGNYWANTRGNILLRSMLESCYTTNKSLKDDLERLINGEEVELDFDETVVYSTMLEKPKAIIGTLLYTGYLTLSKNTTKDKYLFKIPNKEVRSEFVDLIQELNAPVLKDRLGTLFNALVTEDVDGIVSELSYLIKNTISVRMHTTEVLRQIQLASYFLSSDEWEVATEVESGEGYADLVAINTNKDYVIILELKNRPKAERPRERKRLALEAYQQIVDRDYERKYREDDYTTFCYGIAFTGKSLAVSNGTDTIASY